MFDVDKVFHEIATGHRLSWNQHLHLLAARELTGQVTSSITRSNDSSSGIPKRLAPLDSCDTVFDSSVVERPIEGRRDPPLTGLGRR